MEELEIYVATHKKFNDTKIPDPCYKCLLVGAAAHADSYGYLRDDSGDDNISEKNPIYCELTGLYWLWKNAPQQKYIGLCHYRRYPSRHKFGREPFQEILTKDEILSMMQDADILLPKKGKKSKYNGLCRTEEELNSCREYQYIAKAIAEDCPEYLNELKSVFMAKEMCFGNIFVLSRKNLDAYCEWLFRLLCIIEKDIKSKDDEVPREYGYLSEWMLNVWVAHNGLKAEYFHIMFTERDRSFKHLLKRIKEVIFS